MGEHGRLCFFNSFFTFTFLAVMYDVNLWKMLSEDLVKKHKREGKKLLRNNGIFFKNLQVK